MAGVFFFPVFFRAAFFAAPFFTGAFLAGAFRRADFFFAMRCFLERLVSSWWGLFYAVCGSFVGHAAASEISWTLRAIRVPSPLCAGRSRITWSSRLVCRDREHEARQTDG